MSHIDFNVQLLSRNVEMLSLRIDNLQHSYATLKDSTSHRLEELAFKFSVLEQWEIDVKKERASKKLESKDTSSWGTADNSSFSVDTLLDPAGEVTKTLQHLSQRLAMLETEVEAISKSSSLSLEQQVEQLQAAMRSDEAFGSDTSIPSIFQGESTRDLIRPPGLSYTAISIERAASEYRDIVEKATDYSSFSESVYDAATYVIIKDVPHIEAADMKIENWARLSTVSLVLIVNWYLQGMFIYWIYQNLVIPSMHSIQENYKEFHRVAFQSGEFSIQGFNSLGDRRYALCEMALASDSFTSGVIFLWSLHCLDEFRSIYRTWRSLIEGLPSLPSGLSSFHQTYVPPGSNSEMVVCLKGSTRAMLMILIIIPRLLLWFCLAVAGAAFLYSTESRGDLVLNSCALLFVSGVDELLFKVFLPFRMRKNFEKTTYCFPHADVFQHWTGVNLHLNDMQVAYARNAIFVSAAFMFTYLSNIFQQILPGYEWDLEEHCAFVYSEMEPPCKFFESNCFPKS